jgi:hypothetical protein
MACDVAQVSMVQRTVFGEHCDAVSSRDCELDGSSILLLARAIWLIASGYRGIRHVGHRIDVLLVEPMPHNRGTNIGLLQMIGEHNLNIHADEEAADCVWRPAHCLGDLRTAGAFATAQHGKYLRLLRVRPQTRAVDRLVHRSACCQRGANAGDGAYYLRDVNAAALGQPVPGVEQGLRSSREATSAPGRPSWFAGGVRGIVGQHRGRRSHGVVWSVPPSFVCSVSAGALAKESTADSAAIDAEPPAWTSASRGRTMLRPHVPVP